MKFKIFFVFALALSISLVYVFGFRQDSQQLRSSLMAAIHGSRAEAATMSQKAALASEDVQASPTLISQESTQTPNGIGKMGSESDILRTSLIKAVRSDNVELTKKLIKLGADVNSRTSANGWSALHFAVRNGDAEIVQILLKAGADPNCLGKMEGQKDSAVSLRPLVLAQAALDLVTQIPPDNIEETLRQSGLNDPALVKSMTDPNATDRYKKVVDVLTNAHKES
jgi:ankyrin repeat protein